ncbi:Hypothetical predicted protein [Paramuricea clavata]|uniref:tRNA N(3)-methylcytidine methyltransferase n=1 Tax=Paramuricea clavata TaxID=317549 RepID=A0A6S7JCH4_PARCT|nr:Hypothetical predicted protein [Paramuricea clavata]
MTEQFQEYQHSLRKLSEEERTRLQDDAVPVSEFKKNKLEKDAQRNWDLFYKRNSTNFFKDRHWTSREFQELCSDEVLVGKTLLEVGCGVGNTIFPLLEEIPSIFIHACDFSKRAVAFVEENGVYDPKRMNAFQCDITHDRLTTHVSEESVDIITVIFVMSSISPEKMLPALENIAAVLKPGGIVLFRDYGMYDHAMLRFSKGHKISENFYVRQDGTRAYYFTTEYLTKLFSDASYDVINCQYVQRRTINKKEGIDVPRMFVQGKFMKRTSITEQLSDTGKPPAKVLLAASTSP